MSSPLCKIIYFYFSTCF